MQCGGRKGGGGVGEGGGGVGVGKGHSDCCGGSTGNILAS